MKNLESVFPYNIMIAKENNFKFFFNIFLSFYRFLPGGNLTDQKDVVSHYDYSQLGHTNAPGTPHSVSQGFGHAPHESMYYPPPLYPVHHTSASVHSTHHL